MTKAMDDNNMDDLGKRLSDLEERVKQLEQSHHQDSNSTNKAKAKSIKEYIIELSPSDDIQRTLVVASYLETHKEMTSFTAEDIKAYFREARLKPPSNVNDKINKNVAKGWLMDAAKTKDGKKTWNLTMTGEQKIEAGFKGDG